MTKRWRRENILVRLRFHQEERILVSSLETLWPDHVIHASSVAAATAPRTQPRTCPRTPEGNRRRCASALAFLCSVARFSYHRNDAIQMTAKVNVEEYIAAEEHHDI